MRVLEGSTCASMCDANRAPDSDGACDAATAMSVMQRTVIIAQTRVCVTTGQTAAQCQALSMRVLEGSSCASMCDANRAPDSDGACGTATAICDATDGYDSTDRVCVTSGQTAAECQALSMRVLEGSTLCVDVRCRQSPRQ